MSTLDSKACTPAVPPRTFELPIRSQGALITHTALPLAPSLLITQLNIYNGKMFRQK